MKKVCTKNMCLYLSGYYLLSCNAYRSDYAPSVFQLGEYCTAKRHHMCPLYRIAVKERTDRKTAAAGYNSASLLHA